MPGLDFTDPADIPDDYFSSIAEQFGLPLASTEMGWPSEPIEVAGAEAYGDTNEEQLAFLERFGVLIEGLDVRLALWAIPNDVGIFEAPPFESVAIRANDGTPKPALVARRCPKPLKLRTLISLLERLIIP